MQIIGKKTYFYVSRIGPQFIIVSYLNDICCGRRCWLFVFSFSSLLSFSWLLLLLFELLTIRLAAEEEGGPSPLPACAIVLAVVIEPKVRQTSEVKKALFVNFFCLFAD